MNSFTIRLNAAVHVGAATRHELLQLVKVRITVVNVFNNTDLPVPACPLIVQRRG